MNWRNHAACLGAPPEHLYATSRGWKRHPALDYCDRCPVVTECLNDALALGPQAQVYIRGGKTPAERIAMLQRGAA